MQYSAVNTVLSDINECLLAGRSVADHQKTAFVPLLNKISKELNSKIKYVPNSRYGDFLTHMAMKGYSGNAYYLICRMIQKVVDSDKSLDVALTAIASTVEANIENKLFVKSALRIAKVSNAIRADELIPLIDFDYNGFVSNKPNKMTNDYKTIEESLQVYQDADIVAAVYPGMSKPEIDRIIKEQKTIIDSYAESTSREQRRTVVKNEYETMFDAEFYRSPAVQTALLPEPAKVDPSVNLRALEFTNFIKSQKDDNDEAEEISFSAYRKMAADRATRLKTDVELSIETSAEAERYMGIPRIVEMIRQYSIDPIPSHKEARMSLCSHICEAMKKLFAIRMVCPSLVLTEVINGFDIKYRTLGQPDLNINKAEKDIKFGGFVKSYRFSKKNLFNAAWSIYECCLSLVSATKKSLVYVDENLIASALIVDVATYQYLDNQMNLKFISKDVASVIRDTQMAIAIFAICFRATSTTADSINLLTAGESGYEPNSSKGSDKLVVTEEMKQYRSEVSELKKIVLESIAKQNNQGVTNNRSDRDNRNNRGRSNSRSRSRSKSRSKSRGRRNNRSQSRRGRGSRSRGRGRRY